MDYIIEEVKYGVTEGGICCGPVDGIIIASMKVNDGKSSKWLTNTDFVGFTRSYLTDEDIFDKLLKQDFSDEGFEKLLDESALETFSNINLSSYEDILATINNADVSSANLIKAIILVTTYGEDYIENLTNKSVNDVDLSEFYEAMLEH